MRFKRLKRRTSIEQGQFNVVPLVDVVFNLLLFFMLTSNFAIQPGIQVSLPKAVTSEVLSGETLNIYITAQDLLFLNDKPTTTAELNEEFKQAARDNRSMLLKADSKASLGKVVEIWDLCRQYGIPQISIATTKKD